MPYSTSSREQTGDIITFVNFEEANLLSETCDDTESGNEYDDYSTIPPLISEEEMDKMPSGNQYDAETMSTEMLEDICDGNQSHPSVNRREARYKIRDHIKRGQSGWKGEFLST